MKPNKTTLLLAWLGLMPVLAWGLTPLEETQLADVVGQDGVTITIDSPGYIWDQVIYDRDGVPDDGFGVARVLGIPTSLVPGAEAAIVMKGIGLTHTGPMVWTVDAGQSSVGPVLNINLDIPDNTVLHLPDLQLSKPLVTGGWELDPNNTKTIMSAGTTISPGITVTLGATNLNMQLGNVAQEVIVDGTTYRPLLLTDLTIKQGLYIENQTIADASNPASPTYDACGPGANEICAYTVDHVYVNDNSGTLAATKGTSNLTAKGLGMSITSGGLMFVVDQLGYRDGLGVDHGINVQMENVHMGDATVPGMGNAYLKGLQLGADAVLTIAGH